MKFNYDAYFSNKKIEEFIEEVKIYPEMAAGELSINLGSEQNIEIPKEQQGILIQKTQQLFVEDYILKNKISAPVWHAIETMNLEALSNARVSGSLEQYLDTLANSLFINTMLRNHEKVKFLISKTEISESNHLKTEALEFLLSSFKKVDDKDPDEELALLLTQNNSLAHNAYIKHIEYIYYEGMSDKVLIAGLKELPDSNIQITIRYSKDRGQAWQEKQVSLLFRVLSNGRPELAKCLINKGALLLPDEVHNMLWNRGIPDELLMDIFSNLSDLNIQFTIQCMNENGEWQDTQASLLSRVISSYRLELAKCLINKGALLLPDEVHNMLWNRGIPDELLMDIFSNLSDLNIQFTIQCMNENGEWQDTQASLLSRVISSYRLELAKCLISKGALLLPDEVLGLLWNQGIPDELLINSLKALSDSNIQITVNQITVKYKDSDQTWQEKQASLLSRVLEKNRPELAKWLISKGAFVLPNEILSIFGGKDIPDELLMGILSDLPDLNIQIITQKFSDDGGQTWQERQVSLLSRALSKGRPEIAKWLIHKGALVSSNEIQSMFWGKGIPDELLINVFKNAKDISNFLVKDKDIYEQNSAENCLLVLAQDSKRIELFKWLVNNVSWPEKGGNNCKLLSKINEPECFEILVNSGKLIKDNEMTNSFHLEGKWYNQGDLYDLFTWKNTFKNSINIDANCPSLGKWLNNGEIHFVNNLYKVYNKPGLIQIKPFGNALDGLQQSHGQQVIKEHVVKAIFNYFAPHWNESMLICKKFITDVFNSPELKTSIGYFLMDAFKAGELQNLEQLDAAGRVEVVEDN